LRLAAAPRSLTRSTRAGSHALRPASARASRRASCFRQRLLGLLTCNRGLLGTAASVRELALGLIERGGRVISSLLRGPQLVLGSFGRTTRIFRRRAQRLTPLSSFALGIPSSSRRAGTWARLGAATVGAPGGRGEGAA